ncbi:alpha/beta fold hydrolase [Nocardia sp. NPDC020380]|uniref:alpha/beta fold hydrolase n=1 Tax=Nocardia sp. NPDC020380 TaxID=3364309 RepID=UPI0037B02FA7
MEDFEYDGIRIAYVQRGESGPPVVMLHHAGASHLVWMPQIQALAEEYRVFALDLPGYGVSSAPADDYTLERYTELIHQFLVHHELTGVSLVGNCLGSAITLNLTRRYPDLIRAAVVMNPLTESTVLHGRLGRAARLDLAVPGGVIRAFDRWHTPYWLARGTVRYWFTSRRAFRQCPYTTALSAGYPARALLRMIRDLPSFAALDDWPDRAQLPPICTVWGNRNRVLSAPAGRTLNARLHPDRAEFLDDCGHVPMLEQSARVTAILTEFLGQASQSTADTERTWTSASKESDKESTVM